MQHLQRVHASLPYLMAALAIALLLAMTSIKIHLHPEAIAAMEDPDSWLRLVMISDLYHGTGWYDHTIERMDPPLGMVSPWTRPVDILVLTLASPFLMFLPFDSALAVARFLYNPLLLFCAASLLYATARRLTASSMPYSMWLLVPMLLLSPSVGDYFIIGGVDHHSLLSLLAIVLWYLFVRFAESPQRSGLLWPAGACAGLGIWVSTEFQLVAVGFLCSLLWMWCRQEGKHWLRGFLHATGILLGVLCLAVMVEKPLSGLWKVEYDTVSVVHILTFAFLLGAYLLLWLARNLCSTPFMRFAGAGIAGSIAMAAALVVFPEIVHGPMAGVSPALYSTFLNHVAEMQPVWKLGADYVLAFGCYLFIALFLMTKYCRTLPRNELFWWLLLTTGTFFLLTLSARRLAYYYTPLSTLLLLWTLAQLRGEAWVSRIFLRPLTLLVLGLFPVLLPAVSGVVQKELGITNRNPLRYEQCLSSLMPLVESGELVRLLGDEPLLVGMHSNLGPYLLFRTPYRIISSNYHRDVTGLLELKTLLEWKDEAAGKDILKKRGVDALILCEKPRDNLRLPRYLHEASPLWAEEIYAHPGEKDTMLRIYRVLGDSL